MKNIIRLGDSTTHGGVVLEAFSRTDLNGKPIAGVGHNVSCPLCKGGFPIAEGSATYSVDGIAVALDGMKTACGAALIASDPKGAVNR
ncbi:PAAR repeat-containing protein [Pseudomonas weihenstephanensis]|uniref:PAAR repeat-containing protein n=1 Tax=Pseudomonas weihenstephanensis TaxID=1608994 RepID=A0A0J6IKA8_9PSED|nr:PAAR domain-containing protein [Pseudomonas weihenstephanensis]KMN12758.1 PAAR repeat-containing protein [Pseudomonas weihenstephanensis]